MAKKLSAKAQKAATHRKNYWVAICDALINSNGFVWSKPGAVKGGDNPHNGRSGYVYKGSNCFRLSAAQFMGELSPQWYPVRGVLADATKAGIECNKLSEYVGATLGCYRPSRMAPDKKDDTKKVWVNGGAFYVINHDHLHLISPALLEWEGLQKTDLSPAVLEEDDYTKIFNAAVSTSERRTDLSIKLGGDKAYCSGTKIRLPRLNDFKTSQSALTTLSHELAHWTGFNQLERDMRGKFGSAQYAKEELIAELTALLIGQDLGIRGIDGSLSHSDDNGLAYLAGWLGKLPVDERPALLERTFKQANKAKRVIQKEIKPLSIDVSKIG